MFLWVKWPNQQCQSTEGSSSPKDQTSIPPGPPHHVTVIQRIMYGNRHKICIHKNESRHSEMGPVRQTQIQRPVKLLNKLNPETCCTVQEIVRLRYTLLHNWSVLLIFSPTPDQHVTDVAIGDAISEKTTVDWYLLCRWVAVWVMCGQGCKLSGNINKSLESYNVHIFIQLRWYPGSRHKNELCFLNIMHKVKAERSEELFVKNMLILQHHWTWK